MDAMAFPTLTDFDSKLPVYLTSVGGWNHQEPVYRPNGYPHYQWLQVVSGTGEVTLLDRTFVVSAGEGLCLFPYEMHAYRASSRTWGIHWISFDGHLAHSLLQLAGISGSGAYQVSDGERIAAQMQHLYTLTQSGGAFPGLECSKLMYALLLDLKKSLQTDIRSVERHYEKLLPVIRYIESHYDKLITIKDMADHIGVTPQYLCSLFRKALHMRPMEYVNRERINRGKELLLLESRKRVRDIAGEVGFDSPSYFSSMFKRLEGVSPEQFKQMHGITV